MMYGPYYKVHPSEFVKYLTAYFTLNALESGGVDNWSWYSDSISQAIENYNGENGTECETMEEIAEDYILCFEEFYE